MERKFAQPEFTDRQRGRARPSGARARRRWAWRGPAPEFGRPARATLAGRLGPAGAARGPDFRSLSEFLSECITEARAADLGA
jgi:hypothetical protein